MRKLYLPAACLVFMASPLWSQMETSKLKVRAILVDKDLNQKPVPKLSVTLVRAGGNATEAITAKTGFDGMAELELSPGKYHLSTPEPIEFQGKRYSWEIEVALAAPEFVVELSNDNAKVEDVISQKPKRAVDDLTQSFKRYQNSVLTVWSEFGHGTGFIVDPSGLILTNQHVVGPSAYLAVQFDAKRKVAAKLLAFDAEKDIAVLWANINPFPEALVAPLAREKSADPEVVEGERVFTIGSPLSLQKILTTGIVSKVEEHALFSDININHGNSGGPLFNSLGIVVGLTTFKEQATAVSGIVRIGEAQLLLDRAKTKMRDTQPPEPTLLPVEPTGSYPIDALKASLQEEKFDERPYVFGQGNYDVAIITPILKYHLAEGGAVRAQKEKEKRTKKGAEAIQGTFQPLDELRNWAEYIDEYRPVILIEANPRLRETFMSALGRGMAASGGIYGGPAKMRFKTDFYRMRLLCGDKEIQPILPGKVADVLDVHNPFVNVTDATYEGIYSYPYDAISPTCGTVTLELFSEKEPNKPVGKTLDAKTVSRIAIDFEPFRRGQIQVTPEPNSAKP
jgi:S1-C subfamily serine protease